MSEPRVLSISSFVVHGYVGNKCDMFALQTLGIEVDPICTVQFSNHTGYSSWTGTSLSSKQITDLFHGVQANVHARYTHVITGYCNDVSALRELANIVKELRAQNPDLVYLCDPVMGDDGELYVKAEIADIYRSEVVPIANVVKLNKTEAEVLTHTKIETNDDMKRAIDAIHAMGPKTVIISSCPSTCFDGVDGDGNPNMIYIAGSCCCCCCFKSMCGSENGHAENDCNVKKRFFTKVPRIEGYFSGTGDLFSALVVGWMAKGHSAEEACERTVATLKVVLERTAAAKSFELKLVQSKDAVENPPKLEYPLKPF